MERGTHKLHHYGLLLISLIFTCSKAAEASQSDPFELSDIVPVIGIACTEEQVRAKSCLSGECRNDNGLLRCVCEPGYYGELCQFKNFCNLPLVPEERLTGHDICERWTRRGLCIEQEAIAQRFLRCQCDQHESFVYLNKTFYSQQAWARLVEHVNSKAPDPHLEDKEKGPKLDPDQVKYLARCIAADKCYGLKCRHLSEVCRDGKCECNAERGYWRSAADGQCKLVSPCSSPQEFETSGRALCGQAKCVATYDMRLYECVCPPHQTPMQLVFASKNTTICLDTLIEYESGSSSGGEGGSESEGESESDDLEGEEKLEEEPEAKRASLICENPILNPCEHLCEHTPDSSDHSSAFKCSCLPGYELGKTEDTKYQCFYTKDLAWLAAKTRRNESDVSKAPSRECMRRLGCRQHELCVAHPNGSEECHCERQGFVQQAATCVDWCWAARRDARISRALDPVCLSGICEMRQEEKQLTSGDDDQRESHKGKPKFECDCSESKRLTRNEQGLCELNFTAILEACMPGNDGYRDCVVNKGAYCAVMHQDLATLLDELKSPRRLDAQLSADLNPTPTTMQARRYFYDTVFAAKKRREAQLLRDQLRVLNKNTSLYVCVCPPDKRMIVDRERGRAICIKECQLMSDKCSRMNRMCKRAQFLPEDTSYKQRNLIRRDWNSSYPPGSQWLLDLEPPSCECLPGFSPNKQGESKIFPRHQQQQSQAPASFVAAHSNYVMGDPAKNCFMGDDVIRLVNVSFKAPANFDLTWLRPVNESLWNEWSQATSFNDSSSSPASADEQNDAASDHGSNAHSSWFIPRFNEILPEQPLWTRLRDPDLLIKQFALVGECKLAWAKLGSVRMYYECLSYRYWQEHVLKRHYMDWRQILKAHLRDSFNFMRGFVEINIDICKSINRNINNQHYEQHTIDITNDSQVLDGDVFCNLTLHIANTSQQTLAASKINIGPEMKQLIYDEPSDVDLKSGGGDENHEPRLSDNYAWLAPNALITKNSYKNIQKESHYPDFRPCHSTDVRYCSNSTQCVTGIPGIRFECKCAPGFQPVSAIDIGPPGGQYKREICEDIDECLFDVCGENTLRCRNLIGDYKCDCLPKYVLDGRDCVPMCDKVNCKHGICRFQGDYHANCECEDGYIGPDCGQLDPSIALRKANIIICISIFGSILVLAITVAFSQRKQLNKARKELKQLRAENDPMRMYEFYVRQAPPLKTHRSKPHHQQQRPLIKTR